MEEKGQVSKSQNVFLEDRERLSVSGVENVESFNENIIKILTVRGLLTIKGQSMNINKLNLEEENVKIEGEIDSFEYSDKSTSESRKKGLLKKMFK